MTTTKARLERVDTLLTELAIIVRMSRVDGDRETLRYVRDRLDETARTAQEACERIEQAIAARTKRK